MSRKIASREAVYAAADGLQAQGIEPTYERIIQILGGGSNSSVGPHLDTWHASSKPPARPIPDDVSKRATIFAQAVWTAALTSTQADIDRVRAEYSAGIEEGDRALAASIEIGQGLESERDNLAQHVAALTAQCADLKYQLREIESLKNQLASANSLEAARLESCEALKRELFALQQVNKTLELHCEQLLAQFSAGTVRPRGRQSKEIIQKLKA